MGSGDSSVAATPEALWQVGDGALRAGILARAEAIARLQSEQIAAMAEFDVRGLASAAGYRDGAARLAAHTMLEAGSPTTSTNPTTTPSPAPCAARHC